MDTKLNILIVWIFTSEIWCIDGNMLGCRLMHNKVTCFGPFVQELPDGLNNNVTHIQIQFSAIHTLNTSAIMHLHGLTDLMVEDSRLHSITANAFHHLGSLKVLSLKGNMLTSLQRGLFSPLKMLRKLLLDDNYLTSVDGMFTGLTSLEILGLNNNAIETLEVNTFNDLENLHQLNLGNNNLTQILPGTFDNNEQLILLGLGSNPLSSVEKVFPTGMTLQFMNLSSCLLTSFPKDLPPSIKHLHLTNNRITKISKLDTRRYVNLNALMVDENGLTYIEPGALAQMTSLTDVYLFVNNLTQFPGPFPLTIKNVYIDNNQIESLPADMFQNETELNVLSLRINSISSITMDAFQNIKSIKELHLERNKIRTLDDGMFMLVYGLKFLTLNRMSFSKITGDCFLGLNSLEKLDMSFVQVPGDQIYGNIFHNLPNLSSLYLQESQALTESFLSTLKDNQNILTNLTELNLKDSGLTTLNSSLQTYLPNLQKLHLGGNSFNCNAQLVWLKLWYDHEPEKFPMFYRVRCHMPRELQGHRLQYLSISELRGDFQDSSEMSTASYHYDSQTDNYRYDQHYEIYDYYDYKDFVKEVHSTYPDYSEFSSSTTPAVNFDPGTEEITETSTLASINTTFAISRNESKTQIYLNKTQTVKPKSRKTGNNSSIKSVGIAIGTAFAVITVMLLAALLVFKLWHRKRQVLQQNGRHQTNEGQDYVFVVSEKAETKTHRKLSRTERGSTTSRASEDITNQTDLDMKVYMLDVDA